MRGFWLLAPLGGPPPLSTQGVNQERQAAADGGAPENKACASKFGSNRFTPEQGYTMIRPVTPLLSDSQAYKFCLELKT